MATDTMASAASLPSPDDKFAALYYPGHYDQLPTLSARQRRIRRLIGRCSDQDNVPPDVQLEFSEGELHVLRQWRKEASSLVEARIAPFRAREGSYTTVATRQILSRTEHRLFHVPELLDSILRLVSPQDQSAAWNVSHAWRALCKSIIESKSGHVTFWDEHPCSPVEYGQRIEPDLTWLQPTVDEMAHFQTNLQESIDRSLRAYFQGFKHLYFPGRFTQQLHLPADVSSALDSLDDRQNHFAHETAPKPNPASRHPHVYWLDFSQFQINPYFSTLFQDRFSTRHGKCEIALYPSSRSSSMLVDPDTSLSFLRTIEGMFITQPPCKAIGIYFNNPDKFAKKDATFDGSPIQFLGRVQDETGIRVRQLLKELRRHCSHVASLWLEQAEQLKQKVTQGHWIDDVWDIPASPTLLLLLDNTAMEEGTDFHWHITRDPYLTATGFREERQGDWMPFELIEPSKTSTIRHQLNWDA